MEASHGLSKRSFSAISGVAEQRVAMQTLSKGANSLSPSSITSSWLHKQKSTLTKTPVQ
jgi:hypothetical protein